MGSSVSSLTRGEAIVKIMSIMKYDAMVMGNHDFAYGVERLYELIAMADFSMLSANTYKKVDGTNLLSAYTIKEVAGIRIGILGLTTPETMYQTAAQHVKDLIFVDPIEKAKEMVKLLRDRCDFIIALVHLPMEYTEDSCERLANEVDGIDLIVSGHSHLVFENGWEVNDKYIVQTGEKGLNLDIVNIVFENGSPVEVKPSLYSPYSPTWDGEELKTDKDVQMLVDEIDDEFQDILAEEIGWTDVFLDGERAHIRTSQTNLGSLVAQAMLEISGADVTILNGGALRTSIKLGYITRKDLLNVMPFNSLQLIELKGSDIHAALEHGVLSYPEMSGKYPQVAGMIFDFAPDNEPGDRVSNIRIGDEMLDPEKTYKVAVTDFMAGGGDDYTMMVGAPTLGLYGLMADVVAQYIQMYGIRII